MVYQCIYYLLVTINLQLLVWLFVVVYMYVDCYGLHSSHTKFHSCNTNTIVMYCLGQSFVNYMYINYM